MSTNSTQDVSSHLLTHSKLYQVGSVLKKLVETGDMLPPTSLTLNPFYSSESPDISIEWYFVLLCVNTGLQEEQAVVILILIERLCTSAYLKNSPLVINSLSAHR